MEELKPCPFCGGKAKFFQRKEADETGYKDWKRVVFCVKQGCPAHFINLSFSQKDILVKAWNRRV